MSAANMVRHWKKLAFGAVVGAILFSFGQRVHRSPERLAAMIAKDPFYRTDGELSRDGVTLLDMDADEQERVHAAIRDYFGAEYRGIASEGAGQAVDGAGVHVSFSRPRSYQGIGAAFGMFASVTATSHTDEGLGGNTMLFFVKPAGGRYVIVKALPVGEGRKYYEQAPREAFNESLQTR